MLRTLHLKHSLINYQRRQTMITATRTLPSIQNDSLLVHKALEELKLKYPSVQLISVGRLLSKKSTYTTPCDAPGVKRKEVTQTLEKWDITEK